MNWKEKLQVLESLTHRKERENCESEIALDFMKTEIFPRLVKLKDNLIQQGLTTELIPNHADNIELPDASVILIVCKKANNREYFAKFQRLSAEDEDLEDGSPCIMGEVERTASALSACPTVSISYKGISVLESYLKDFKDNFS